MSTFLQAGVAGLSQGSVYALLALGLTIVYRATTILNFSHGESFMLGAFFTLTLNRLFDLPYLPSILLAIAAVFVVGLLLEWGIIERLLEAPHLSQVFATIAIIFLLRGTVRYFQIDQRPLQPIFGIEPVRLGGVAFNSQYFVTVGVLILLLPLTAYVFKRTSIGRILRATTESLRGASLVGIDVRLVFRFTWATAAAIGAVAGILAGPVFLVSADMGDRPLILAFAAMTLGGFGSIPGAVVGGLIVGLTEIFAAVYISTLLGDVAGLALIFVVLLIRPQGLFASKYALSH